MQYDQSKRLVCQASAFTRPPGGLASYTQTPTSVDPNYFTIPGDGTGYTNPQPLAPELIDNINRFNNPAADPAQRIVSAVQLSAVGPTMSFGTTPTYSQLSMATSSQGQRPARSQSTPLSAYQCVNDWDSNNPDMDSLQNVSQTVPQNVSQNSSANSSVENFLSDITSLDTPTTTS